MLVENIAKQSPNRICLNLIKALATIRLGWYVGVYYRPKGHGLLAAHYTFAFTRFHHTIHLRLFLNDEHVTLLVVMAIYPHTAF
jgi:hypothetical protein